MFLKISGIYLPIKHCIIDDSDPNQALVRAPNGKSYAFRGEALQALRAFLQYLENENQVVDVEKAFKRAEDKTPEVSVPPVVLPKLPTKLTRPR